MTANTIDKIEAFLDEHPGMKVVHLDSMHLVIAADRQGISEIEFISKSLPRIAAERQIAIVALCEVNRVSADMRDPVFIPEPYNIRGSRQLNHDFHDTLLLGRPTRKSGVLMVRDGKGRHRSQAGDLFLRFDGAHQQVTAGEGLEGQWHSDCEEVRRLYGFKGTGQGKSATRASDTALDLEGAAF
jgi:hypothetical protein